MRFGFLAFCLLGATALAGAIPKGSSQEHDPATLTKRAPKGVLYSVIDFKKDSKNKKQFTFTVVPKKGKKTRGVGEFRFDLAAQGYGYTSDGQYILVVTKNKISLQRESEDGRIKQYDAGSRAQSTGKLDKNGVPKKQTDLPQMKLKTPQDLQDIGGVFFSVEPTSSIPKMFDFTKRVDKMYKKLSGAKS